ncbi:MAG: DUF1553 domain-containing protein [Planctomycetes bacterium]|nr:DUF1553 domain-containing protein [Planctomycetota bacterium]
MAPSTTLLAALSLSVIAPHAAAQHGDDEGARLYTEEVQPLLEEHCLSCHGGGRRLKGGLNLTTRAGLLEGGDLGPAVNEGSPERSLLLAMTSYKDIDHEMPPKGKLPGQALDLLERWVHMGAPYAGDAAHAGSEEEEHIGRDDGMEGWSYKPRTKPAVPAVKGSNWVSNPIDNFLLAKLEEAALEPAPEASRIALIRRASYDLTGLPPTPEEVEAFLQDTEPGAWERLLDRLLASEHYGEKWGRHWLDLVRYAETNGFERDSDKPMMWRYRDYVIRAFNEDKPYDRFIQEQLAGDELDDADADAIIATGFMRLHQWDDEPGAGALQHKYDNLDDVAKTASEAFLGMTMGCARCHDHKGDPVTQKEYFSFISFFHGIRPIIRGGDNLVMAMSDEEMRAYEEAVEKKDREERDMAKVLRELEADFWDRYTKKEGAVGDLASMEPVRFRFYRETWNKLPNFDMYLHEDEGRLPSGFFDISPATRNDSFGFVFDSNLRIPASGDYLFQLDTDDGSRVLVDDKEVVRYDGIHGLGTVKEAVATLEAGLSPITLEFFQGTGGKGLKAWWASADALRWQYTTDDPGEGWEQPGFDDSGWKTGLGGFGDRNVRPPRSVIRTQWDTPEIWLRQRFWWDGEEDDELAFAFYHDDDLRVYVNGALALSRDGYIVDYTVAGSTPEGQAALKPGWNDLAVSCNQDFGGRYVQVRPIKRSQALTSTPRDLAFGRMPLSREAMNGAGVDPKTLMADFGHEVMSEEEITRYEETTERLESSRGRQVPAEKAFAIISDGPHPQDLHVHIRGNAASRGEKVDPDFPDCVDDSVVAVPEPEAGAKTSGRRRFLAEWISSPENPLTARVMVNRLWQHHFGRGIVSTPSDFGEFGQRPTHPELLDWLANDLVASGWSLKAMHRRMMSSSAYRMSSIASDDAMLRDAENHLLTRFELRRLGAEEVRDAILATNGTLNRQMYGPSIYSMMPKEALATSSRPDSVWGRSPEDQVRRRSVYIKIKRSLTTPLLAAFDVADTDQSCPERFVTTQPAQALALLNGEFINKQAGLFAERLREDAGDRLEDQIRRGLHLALGREPDEREVLLHASFTNSLQAEQGLSAEQALVDFCLVTYNLNEFIYLD